MGVRKTRCDRSQRTVMTSGITLVVAGIFRVNNGPQRDDKLIRPWSILLSRKHAPPFLHYLVGVTVKGPYLAPLPIAQRVWGGSPSRGAGRSPAKPKIRLTFNANPYININI